MYNDILLSGGRRFAVLTSHPNNGATEFGDSTEGTKFGRYGVVFYLTDLNDVSDKSGDAVKYIVQHAVVGIVKVNEFVNPEAWESRETYLKAKVEVVEEVRGGEGERSELWESVVGPVMEIYLMRLKCTICDPSTRRLGAMIRRQCQKRLQINYPEEQQRSTVCFSCSYRFLLSI